MNPLVLSAIVSLLTVVLIHLGFIPLRSRLERKRAARYLAIRVVCVLDKYVSACSAISGDEGENRQDDGRLVAKHRRPDILVYPADIDWKSIDHRLMYELLSFPAEVERVNSYLDEYEDVCSPPDMDGFFEVRQMEYGRLTVLGYELATKLRTAFEIEALDYSSWNPVAYARDEMEKIKAKRAERAVAFRAQL